MRCGPSCRWPEFMRRQPREAQQNTLVRQNSLVHSTARPHWMMSRHHHRHLPPVHATGGNRGRLHEHGKEHRPQPWAINLCKVLLRSLARRPSRALSRQRHSLQRAHAGANVKAYLLCWPPGTPSSIRSRACTLPCALHPLHPAGRSDMGSCITMPWLGATTSSTRRPALQDWHPADSDLHSCLAGGSTGTRVSNPAAAGRWKQGRNSPGVMPYHATLAYSSVQVATSPR